MKGNNKVRREKGRKTKNINLFLYTHQDKGLEGVATQCADKLQTLSLLNNYGITKNGYGKLFKGLCTKEKEGILKSLHLSCSTAPTFLAELPLSIEWLQITNSFDDDPDGAIKIIAERAEKLRGIFLNQYCITSE